MNTIESNYLTLAIDCGFDHVGSLNVAALEFLPEVREMCRQDLCHSFGKCWTCPPHCGTLEEARDQAARFSQGILVQTTGSLKDDRDWEAIHAIQDRHLTQFYELVRRVRLLDPHCLPMSAGSCHICESCSCPEEPCRYPELAIPSMEAYGIFVSRVCEGSGMQYNYGPQTVTFTSCILLH